MAVVFLPKGKTAGQSNRRSAITRNAFPAVVKWSANLGVNRQACGVFIIEVGFLLLVQQHCLAGITGGDNVSGLSSMAAVMQAGQHRVLQGGGDYDMWTIEDKVTIPVQLVV